MWESRRDFQRVWERWEAGLMAFHALNILSFLWSAFRRQGWIKLDATQRNEPHLPRNADCYRLSMSALAKNPVLRERQQRSCAGAFLRHRNKIQIRTRDDTGTVMNTREEFMDLYTEPPSSGAAVYRDVPSLDPSHSRYLLAADGRHTIFMGKTCRRLLLICLRLVTTLQR